MYCTYVYIQRSRLSRSLLNGELNISLLLSTLVALVSHLHIFKEFQQLREIDVRTNGAHSIVTASCTVSTILLIAQQTV